MPTLNSDDSFDYFSNQRTKQSIDVLKEKDNKTDLEIQRLENAIKMLKEEKLKEIEKETKQEQTLIQTDSKLQSEIDLLKQQNQILFEELKKLNSIPEKPIEEIKEIPIEQDIPFYVKPKKRFIFFPAKKVKIPFQQKEIKPEELINEEGLKIPISEDLERPKRCPLCNSRIKASWVKNEGDYMKQNFKCKNKFCNFSKEIKFRA